MELKSLSETLTLAARLGITTTGRTRDEIAIDIGRKLGRGVVLNFSHGPASRAHLNPRPRGK